MRPARLLALTLGMLSAAPARAQTPLGPEVQLIPREQITDTVQNGATVACDASASCALFWVSATPQGSRGNFRLWERTMAPDGLFSPVRLLRADEGIWPTTWAVPLAPGFLLIGQTPSVSNSSTETLRWYDASFNPLTGVVELPFRSPPAYGDPDSIYGPGPFLPIPGGFVELGMALDEPLGVDHCSNDGCWWGTFLYFFDLHGNKLRNRVAINEDTSGDEQALWFSLGVDADANIVVTFYRTLGFEPPRSSQVYVRRFTARGEPLGPEQLVSDDVPESNEWSSVAVAPDGQFLVSWRNQRHSIPSDFGFVYARRFGADGQPLGPSFLVSHDRPSQSTPMVTADRHGNFFVLWSSRESGNADVRGRLYRHDGRPVTRDDLVINQIRPYDAYAQLASMAAFAANGTLVVSYATFDPNVTGFGLESLNLIRRYAASPGPEICAIAGRRVQCDLGRTGGVAELALEAAATKAATILFGDVDGDGREDACSYAAGRFACDVSHEGTAPFWHARFGFAGDVPLLGDVDGDGVAETCAWRRGRVLVCDTHHDGTEAYRLQLGRQRGTPLLGDLEGDGRADLCVVDRASWICRLSQSGERQRFAFGDAGSSPGLGDADLDGRADPCLLRRGLLRCDTKHQGGAGDYVLQLDVPAGARLLFGNLDGL